jgi:magnesium transporter
MTPEIPDISAQKEQLFDRLGGQAAELQAFLEGVHPADLAEWLLDLGPEESWAVLEALDKEARAEVLALAEDGARTPLLERMSLEQLSEVVQELPADDVVDLLALVGDDVTEEVLRGVDLERAAGLRKLSRYDPESAGGVMNSELVTVSADLRIGDAIKLIKIEGEEAEETHGIFVVDEEDRPIGYLSDRQLITHSIHEEVCEVMAQPVTIASGADQEEAAGLVQHYQLEELAVVDAAGVLVGSIAADDAHIVLEEEASEDFLKLVGAPADQPTRQSVPRRVRNRLPLQGVTVLGGLLTAWILDLALGEHLSGDADLLRFIPIVIGLAGNVGIQSSTILVRGFATGEVERDRELAVLRGEVTVGFLIGLICGAATTLISTTVEADTMAPAFAVAVGVAIAVAVTWAAMLGCVVPLVCRRVGIDPAVVAGPFLITVSDISGTVLYLGVAHILLPA